MHEPKVGDEGQRYVMSALNPDGSKCVRGWSDMTERVERLMEGVKLHQCMHTRVVKDRQSLTDEEKQKLDKLIRDELVDTLGNTDIQVDCYEMIYENFVTQDAPLIDERDKVISAYLDKRWECWRRLLTEVIQLSVRDAKDANS